MTMTEQATMSDAMAPGLRVAFQGERGAYSEQALLTYFPQAQTLPCRSFADAFDAVAGGQADYAAIPIENSQAGSINDAYDLLLKHELHIVGEIKFRVRHCLLALPGQTLADIKRVYSHPQALAQSIEYLHTLGVEVLVAYDTAGSAKMIADEQLMGAGAVAGSLAGQLYGLAILQEGIETNPNNYTRFFVISREDRPSPADSPSKTSIVLATGNTPGALYRALGCIAWRGINLTKLESRPSRDKPWEYVFYVDFEGAADREPFRSALEELRSQCQWVRVLGTYPAARSEV